MVWEPALAADRSTVPEAMSSIRDVAVSKLLFMVVAMTPVGPVFSHPLQYKPEKGTWLHCICVYFYFLSCFFYDILWIHTCCLLNAAIDVGDDSFTWVKRYRWINEGALVAYTADNQTAWNILNLSREHCVCSLTWTLKARSKMSKNRCKTCRIKDIWFAPKGFFFFFLTKKVTLLIHAVSFVHTKCGNTTASIDVFVLFHNVTLCFEMRGALVLCCDAVLVSFHLCQVSSLISQSLHMWKEKG